MLIYPRAMTAEQIRALFACDATEPQREFVQACPESFFRDHVLDMVTAKPRDVNLRVLNILSDDYRRHGETSLALAIGQATFALARSFSEEDPANDNLVEAAAHAAVSITQLFTATGRHDEVIAFVPEVMQWLGARNSHSRTGVLLLDLAEAYRQREQFNSARDALVRAARFLRPDQTLDRERHQFMSDQIERLVGQSATDVAPQPQTESALLQDFNKDLKAVKRNLRKKSLAGAPAAPVVAALAKVSEQTPQSSRELLEHVSPSMEQLSQFVTGGAEGEMNLSRNRWRKRRANEILLDEKQGQDPERLAHARALLLDAEAWARENGYIDDANAALWGLYLCNARTGAKTEAISNLHAIWHSLEGIRANIADPFKRAGVFSEFPRLFGCLSRWLCETGRFEEMLAAAEAAKGRVIEDVLSTNGADYLVSSLNIAERTRKALARLDAHYVSFVVDTEASYAVLVTRRGELHGHVIPMNRAELRKYARWTDPRCWGKRPDGFKGEQVPKDVYARLAPFVEWLAPYFADGTIHHDDHICYAPHEELFFVPLHALPVAGGLLIDYCSVSRLHHASGLERLAACKATRPKRYCGVYVPAAQDLPDRKKLADLRRPIDWLSSHSKGRQLAGSLASAERIAQGNLTARVLHFAAHGVFPEDKSQNPFHRSGVLLPHEGEAPPRHDYSEVHLLSPARVMNLDVSGSHVTLQACVSGLMREGVGGDALGLEWALMLRNADSILSTHWIVSSKESSAFCISFYKQWLATRKSRAAAWRRSCLALKKKGALLWSSFSLSGDWR